MAKRKLKNGTDGIEFIGRNADDVTGSCTYIVFDDKKILLECGMYQDNDILRAYKANTEKFSFNPVHIDYVFIGHQHQDHIGLLPRLYKEGCEAKIICTREAAVIMKIILENSSYILNEEAKQLSKKYKRTYEPVYTLDDVHNCLKHVVTYDQYHTCYQLDDKVSFKFIPNSHCIGATQIYLVLKNDIKLRRILYTSDLGGFNKNNHYVMPTEQCTDFVDVAIMESTYGTNSKPNKTNRNFDLEHLKSAIETTIARKGTVLMPAFSFARSQELLTSLYLAFHENEKFKTQIIVDSVMTVEICKAYTKLLQDEHFELWKKILEWDNVKFVTDKAISNMTIKDKTPKIIISSSGFCMNGRIVNYLQEYLKDPNSMIIFSGFTGVDESYLSYRIKNSKDNKAIKINHKNIANKADCISLQSYSSHANFTDLVKYGSSLNTNCLVLVHGSSESKQNLAQALRKKISEQNKTYKVRCAERAMSIAL